MEPPVVVEGPQGFPVVDVLASVQQRRDAIGVDLQRGHFIPEPLAHRGTGQFELGRCQLSDQQEYQLLLFAFSKAAHKVVLHLFLLLSFSLATAA